MKNMCQTSKFLASYKWVKLRKKWGQIHKWESGENLSGEMPLIAI